MKQAPKEDPAIQIYLSEYDKLKAEEIQRLGFRDNLIYASLIAMTGTFSIGTTNVDRILALLVLPVICVVLGWTYLVNDEKISAIGRYIRFTLSEKICKAIQSKESNMFEWETSHRADKRRVSRKVIQMLVDEFVFVLPGFVAIIIFWINAPAILLPLRWVAGAEGFLLLILSIQVFSYADLKKSSQ